MRMHNGFVDVPVKRWLGAMALAAIVGAAGIAAAPAKQAYSAAPPSDEPVFDPRTGTMRMQDNMDGYASAAAMGSVSAVRTPRIAPLPSPVGTSQPVRQEINSVISPGRNGTGNALRLTFPGAVQSGAVWYTINNTPTPASTSHYFQYYARVNFGGPFTGTLAVKWFEAWHVKLDRVQWNTHDRLPCPRGNSPTYWQVYDQGHATTCQGNQPSGPYLRNVADNQWHRYTYSYRGNSAPGARDGFARMWIDGWKIIDISAASIGVIPPFGEKPWCFADDVDALAVNDPIDHVEWGSTQTTLSPSWTLDIDDFVWWTVP